MEPASDASPPVEYEACTAGALAADGRLWALYEASFPASERETRDAILASLRQGPGLVLRARLDGQTVGLATAHLLRDPPAVFLVYLAVEPSCRGRGIGRELLERIWGEGAERLRRAERPPCGMVWEAEDPGAADDPAGRELRLRRIAYYRRCGGDVLDRPYRQPPLDGATCPPMRLLFRPAVGQPMPDRHAADALVRAMYFEKYGAINGIRAALLHNMLREP